MSQLKPSPFGSLSQELASLQKERRAAISSCDFSKTRILDARIDRLKAEIATTAASSTKVETTLTLDLKREELRAKASGLLQKAREEILQKEEIYQKRIIQLHATHGDELAQWGERYATALELETTRPNPTVAHLRRQAQFNAQQRNYEIADALMEEADQVKKVQIEKAQADVTRVFEEQRLRIVARHEHDLSLCNTRRSRDVLEAQKKYEKEFVTLKNAYAKTVAHLTGDSSNVSYDFLNEFVLTETEAAPAVPSPGRSEGNQSSLEGSKKDTPGSGRKPSGESVRARIRIASVNT
jgi:hypothetical protein